MDFSQKRFDLQTRPDGLFLCVRLAGANATWVIAEQFSGADGQAAVGTHGVLARGPLSLPPACKYPTYAPLTLNLTIVGASLGARVAHAGQLLLSKHLQLEGGSAPESGWVAIASSWDKLAFDDFHLHEAAGGHRTRCGRPLVGQSPVIVSCGTAEALSGMRWDLKPGPMGTTVRLRNTSLCLEAVPSGLPPPPLPPSPPLPPPPPGGVAWSDTHH
eukprot:SAG22_NODE_2047_length_3086_cov_1.470037_3_plen_215_part_01